MLRYDAVLFDLDGTLLDTLDDLTRAVNHAMREGGYAEHTREAVRSFVGNGVGALIQRALPREVEYDGEAYRLALQTFKAYYAAHNCDMTDPYPGICDMLSALSGAGVRLAIISNKNEPNVAALSDKYFKPWISTAIGEREDMRRKPAPDMLYRVMDELACDRSRALYVGDSDVDLQTAENAGIDCVSVCWGFQDEDKLIAAGAKRLIRTPEELTALALAKAD